MDESKKLFGVPMQSELDRTEYVANSGTVYVWQVVTLWVDVGDVVRQEHRYEAWRIKSAVGCSGVLSDSDVPQEVLDARDPPTLLPDGVVADPSDGPESSSEDSVWAEGPCVIYADNPDEEEPMEEADEDEEPEEIQPEDWSDVDAA